MSAPLLHEAFFTNSVMVAEDMRNAFVEKFRCV